MKLLPYLRRLSILDTHGHIVRFQPNGFQVRFVHEIERSIDRNGRARIIVLKARQIGISTVSEAVLFTLAFAIPHYRGLIISHEAPSARHLLSMAHTYWNSYPLRSLYTTKYEAQNMLAWNETGSSLTVATAKNTGAGASQTIRFLHASEVSKWDKAAELMSALAPAIPNTRFSVVVKESTAEGRGNYFHQEWLAAETGDSDYTPLFFPWFQHEAYRASVIGIPTAIGAKTEEERIIAKAFGVDDDQLAWRRHTIRNDCRGDVLTFHKNYPCDPAEAFISTGTNVFPLESLKAVYRPRRGSRGKLVRTSAGGVKFLEDPAGPLTLFQRPSEGKQRDWGVYIIGADPTRTIFGDYAVAHVINRRTLEQVAVFRKRVNGAGFGTELAKLGLFYHQAVIAPEIQGPGVNTLATLMALHYPRIWKDQRWNSTPGTEKGDQYGWSETEQNKHAAIGWLLRVVEDRSILIHDKITFQELDDFVVLPNGGYGNASKNGHDDTVMSLAIAVAVHQAEPPVPAWVESQPTEPDVEQAWQFDEEMMA